MTPDVTQLLVSISDGDRLASEQLLPLVYEELRRLAGHYLQRESPGQTLQPTALVHEAYLRLVGTTEPQAWDSRRHFFAAAANAMRRILVDNARRKGALKRGGDAQRIDLSLEALPATLTPGDDDQLVRLDEALTRLACKDERAARLVELRFFAGLSMQEAADALGISLRSAERDWTYARAWLFDQVEESAKSANV